MSGTLFVVATPIGNLEDLTFRALRTLKDVDVIAAEDTRRTAKLLAHYQVRKPLMSVHEHNEQREIPRVIERLRRGESIALVTDAGTPGIADPGARVVHAVRAAGLPVVPIPGPSAVAAALSVSGFPADQFVFMGFPPRSGSAREEWFRTLKADRRAVVFFEAPHRIERTLSDLKLLSVKRPILIGREMSKIHEQLVYIGNWTVSERPNRSSGPPESRGEFTIIVGSAENDDTEQRQHSDVVDIFGRLTNLAEFTDDIALHIMESAFNVSPSEVRKAVKRHRISVDQQNKSRA